MKSLLSLVLLAAAAFAADKPFVPMFDGKTLNGWEVCNGSATYVMEKGVITGTTAKGSPNTFLCTKKEYGDFILELDAMTDPALNSGVQVRSHRYPEEQTVTVFNGKQTLQRKQPKGRVHGYQVEIANEEAAHNGGIYDEARRGWLDMLKPGTPGVKAYHDNQWNHFRIEAKGDSIKTFVNNVACADIRDPMDQSGFIALQVHQFSGDKPAQVRFRNVRIQDLGRHTWKPLWDGKTLKGWTPRGGAEFKVEDGAIHAKSKADDPAIGVLISDQSIQDATIRLKFKMVKGNSGLFLRAEPKTLAGYEEEIDDGKRTGGLWEPGGRKWVTGPEDNKAVKAGDWNELTASLHGHRVVFHLNGVKTVDLPEDTQGRTEGRIALQCHGAKRETEIWFKDIEILK